MSRGPGFIGLAQRQGAAMLDGIVARDRLHLSPGRLSRAAGRRVRAGIAAVEAYLRRLLILLALQLEAGLRADPSPYIKYHRTACPRSPRVRFDVFTGERDFPGIETGLSPFPGRPVGNGGPVPAAPLIARLSALRALAADPQARARRLAFHLARRRPGLLLPPGRGGLNRRYGREAGMVYTALGQVILERARGRPPPLGPRPRAGPRLRRL